MKRVIWATAVVSLTLLALAAAPSHADFNVGYYTHNTCTNWSNSSTRVDPVNFVYFNWGTLGRVVNQLLYHSGGLAYNWNNHDGSHQNFITHSTCYDQDDQMADSQGWTDRTHFRMKAVHSYPGLGWTVIADAHTERAVVCGGLPNHAVVGNDQQPVPGVYGGFDYGRF